jgi:hypothetical protein
LWREKKRIATAHGAAFYGWEPSIVVLHASIHECERLEEKGRQHTYCELIKALLASKIIANHACLISLGIDRINNWR